ncbi:MAG TPA: OmpH family outer membrane protein [Planctomycetaceae bacterium]|jgi:Skp family chaperone for outer membrane proteins
MLRRTSVAVLCGFLATFTGCGKTAPESVAAKTDKTEKADKPVGGVGVVDLDKVAKVIGRDIEMGQKVDEEVASLNNKLTTLQGALQRQLEDKREKFGSDPTEEQLKELQSSENLMERQLLERKRKAEGELTIFRQKLVDQFREQAKPVLREVAASRGLSIVVPKNDGLLLSIDPACEITDEVAAKMGAALNSDESEDKAPGKPRKAAAETSAR